MLYSMTGYGNGEFEKNGISARVEIRSVNNRFLELTVRLPRTLQLRENDVKELVRKRLVRGKINISVTVERNQTEELPIKVNQAAAKAYFQLLQDLRSAVKIRQAVSLQHLLTFSDIFEAPKEEETDEQEWLVVERAISLGMDKLLQMRLNEGNELTIDLKSRLENIAGIVSEIEQLSKLRIPIERERLRERVKQIASDPAIIDEKRLEFELLLLADKLDVTEECVRFKSHNKYFLEALMKDEAAGRKMTFLLQEMNREANTIGSKSSDSEISQKVVIIKDELEKIREQLQNIE